jgi:hypothetical protein
MVIIPMLVNNEAELLRIVIALRELMNTNDNCGYALRSNLQFVSEEASRLSEEAEPLVVEAANKIHELLQEIEKSKLYTQMAKRERRRKRLNTHEKSQ